MNERNEVVESTSESEFQHRTGGRGQRSEVWPEVHLGKLAKKLGVTRGHLGCVMTGAKGGSLKLLRAIAEELNVDVWKLVEKLEALKAERSERRNEHEEVNR